MDEGTRRWRLALGEEVSDGLDSLDGRDRRVDVCLTELYGDRRDGRSRSAPVALGWLAAMRELFSHSLQLDLQRDAVDHFGLLALLTDPQVAAGLEPDVRLAAQLLALRHSVPDSARAQVHQIVERTVRDVTRRLTDPVSNAARGALNRAAVTSRPRPADIDWPRTIRRNLRHYQPDLATVIPAQIVGHPRRAHGVARELHMCVDQSGSMAASVVYAGILSCILARVPSLRTRFVAYDTALVDLTDALHDPVELLFGTQLGGGTDTSPALQFCRANMTAPSRSTLVLISDLFDANVPRILATVQQIVDDGVAVRVIPALDDRGRASFSREAAETLAHMGVPVRAATPDGFVDLLADLLRS